MNNFAPQYVEEEEYVRNGVGKFDKNKPFVAHPYQYPNKDFAYEVRRQGSGADRAMAHYHANPIKYGNRGPEDPQDDMLPGRGDHEAMLSNRPQIAAASDDAIIWVCEGEPDADALAALGEVATTNSNGARFWRKEFSDELTGHHIIICEDNDDAGRERTKKILTTLRKVAKSVSVVRFEDMPEKSDVRDFLEAGHSLEDLKARVEKLDELIFISTKTAEMVDQIEAQLMRSGAEIYGRSDSLVRVISDEGKVMLHTMTAHGLKDHISRHCTFAKLNKKEEQVPAAATLDMALALLSRVGEWTFPEIAAVHTAPIVTREGDVINTPGFDGATGLYLVLPKGQVDIGETRAEAEIAKTAIVDELLAEFPVVDKNPRSVDLSVLLAGLLTPLARPVISAAPMVCVRAHTPGTGKSYYVDLASMLALNQTADGVTMTNEEENTKTLSAEAMKGRPLISIDNANGVIKGDFLSQLIERPSVSPRILGKSENPTIRNVFTIFTNGNNSVIEGDLVRRVILTNLDAGLERPETRVFQSDPLELISGNREKWLGYALTIMRAYLKSGERVEVEPFGSFSQWSRMVREAIVWLDMADPVESVKSIRKEDPHLANMAALFDAWPNVGSGFTAGELVSHANDAYGGPLRVALLQVAGDGRDGINTQKLGYYLRSIKGRIVGNARLTGGPSAAANSNRYELQEVA